MIFNLENFGFGLPDVQNKQKQCMSHTAPESAKRVESSGQNLDKMAV